MAMAAEPRCHTRHRGSLPTGYCGLWARVGCDEIGVPRLRCTWRSSGTASAVSASRTKKSPIPDPRALFRFTNLNNGQDTRANRTRHTTSSSTQSHAKQQHTNATQTHLTFTRTHNTSRHTPSACQPPPRASAPARGTIAPVVLHQLSAISASGTASAVSASRTKKSLVEVPDPRCSMALFRYRIRY